MDFDTIVSKIMTRLNLTSTEAQNRIEAEVNECVRKITTSIALEPSRLMVEELDIDPIGEGTLPELVVDNYNKLLKVSLLPNGTGTPQVKVLKELMYDEITNFNAEVRDPRAWAVKTVGPSSMVIVLDSSPDDNFTLRFEGYQSITDLSGTDQPPFPDDFHDLIIFGVMADELFKMEKYPYAQQMEQKFQQRLSDLRYYFAKSAYLDVYQSKNKPSRLWAYPWLQRTSFWNN